MPALICGSLAFDTITTFHGRFAQQILPEQVHILNVSFLVPTLRREFGGCAGNIAYTLRALGGEPVVMAALGEDGAEYLARLRGWGVDTSLVRSVPGQYTAQAIIITDTDNNQITAFHPGAMQHAHEAAVPAARADLAIAIVAPDGRDAMLQHAAQLHAAGVPFVFDPGQGLPMFDGGELRGAGQPARRAQDCQPGGAEPRGRSRAARARGLSTRWTDEKARPGPGSVARATRPGAGSSSLRACCRSGTARRPPGSAWSWPRGQAWKRPSWPPPSSPAPSSPRPSSPGPSWRPPS